MGAGYLRLECPREVKHRFVGNKPQGIKNPTRLVKCCSCVGKSHISTVCPAKPNIYCRLHNVESGLR